MIKSSPESCSSTACDIGATTRCPCAPVPTTPAASPSSKGAVAVSGVAIAGCVACCTLPFALPTVALASAAPFLVWLEDAQNWMTPLAVAATLLAWAWTGWQSVRTRAAPARSTMAAMSLATALLLPALAWPWIEPPLVRLLKGKSPLAAAPIRRNSANDAGGPAT